MSGKITLRKSLTNRQLAVGLSLLIAFLAVSITQAAVVVTIDGSSPDVVVTASGSLDITGATAHAPGAAYSLGVIAGGTSWFVAPGSGQAFDSYFLTTVQAPFGTSTSLASPSSVSGDSFFIFGGGIVPANVGVNAGYVSGDPIFSQITFSNTSLADLTLNEGTFNFTLPNDEIELTILVPEPSLLSALCGVGIFCLAVWGRHVTHERLPVGKLDSATNQCRSGVARDLESHLCVVCDFFFRLRFVDRLDFFQVGSASAIITESCPPI